MQFRLHDIPFISTVRQKMQYHKPVSKLCGWYAVSTTVMDTRYLFLNYFHMSPIKFFLFSCILMCACL